MLSKRFFEERSLQDMVENQTTYTMNSAAMHVFETHKRAEQVLLKFDQPVLASMLEGKKIMHLRDSQSFDFLPGESLVLPAEEIMRIDFPEAKEKNPTRCLAMAISEDKIKQTLYLMNEKLPKFDERDWSLMDYNFHFSNDREIFQIIQRLLYLFTENHPSKDLFVDNMLQELVIRVLQTNSKKAYLENSAQFQQSSRLRYVIEFIRKNIHQNICIEELSKQAYMSESNFYRVFKNEMGISPVEFINEERIKLATELLKESDRKIKDVFMECGFESRSYFNRVFKKIKKVSPGKFQAQYQ